jgi:hypothetical protein
MRWQVSATSWSIGDVWPQIMPGSMMKCDVW